MKTETRLTARYAETDQMGIVHHSNYAVWFEAGRTDFLKKAGISYSELEAMGILLPLYELNCRFLSPARYEDEITVVTSARSVSRVRICLSYQVIHVESGRILTTGETKHAWTTKALKPCNAERAAPEVYAMLLKAIGTEP